MSGTAFAIPLALFTTAAFNAGLIVEKRALATMPPLQLSRAGQAVVRLLSTPAWLAGLALMLAGLVGQVIVLAIEPISVVQPVLASGIALTLVLSRVVLRERMGPAESGCVVIMVASLILLALSQDAASERVTRDPGPLLAAAVVLPSLLAGLMVAAWPWRQGDAARGSAATALYAGAGTGLLYGVSALASKGLSTVLPGHHAAAGLLGAVLSSPYLYLLGACSAAGMLLYQAALQACRASVLVPVSNVVSSGYFLVVGSWLFHQQLPASHVKLSLRLTGIAAAAVVLVILSRQASSPPAPLPGEPGVVSTE